MDNKCLRFNSSSSGQKSFWDTFGQFYSKIHDYDTGFIVVFGLICNVLMLIVLTRKRMSNASNLFLIGITIADMATLSTYFCIWLPLVMYKKYSYQHSFWFTQIFTSFSIFKSVSTWLTVLLGLWRVVNLYQPSGIFFELNKKNARIIVLGCYIVMHVTHVTHVLSYVVGNVECELTDGTLKNYFFVSSFCSKKFQLILFQCSMTTGRRTR